MQSKKRNRFEQERASRLAHVHWSLRYQARLTDPRYEELILPDVTENTIACKDNVWDGAVTDEVDSDDNEELVTRMGNAEATKEHARLRIICLASRFASYLHTPAYWPRPSLQPTGTLAH